MGTDREKSGFRGFRTAPAGNSAAMQITDCPYAAGTPEHGEWVRNVYIPAVESERAVIDRRKHGAPSIGGALIRGLVPDTEGSADLARLFVRVA
jgi:hypothetical protein